MCAGVYPIQVFVNLLYILVNTLSAHILCRICTCTRVCTLCLLALEGEGGGAQLVYAGHLLLVWRAVLYRGRGRGVVLYLLCIISSSLH